MLARFFHNCNFLNGSTNAHWQFSLLQQPLFMACFVFVISSICVLSSNYTTELSRADEALISCSCYSSFSRSTKKLVAKWMVAQPLISLCHSLTLFHSHSPHTHTHTSPSLTLFLSLTLVYSSSLINQCPLLSVSFSPSSLIPLILFPSGTLSLSHITRSTQRAYLPTPSNTLSLSPTAESLCLF